DQSIATLQPVGQMESWQRTPYGPLPAVPAEADAFRATAVSLAEGVMSRRFTEGGEIRLQQAHLGNEGYDGMAPLGADLYEGLPGIALFYAHLGVQTGEVRYRRFAERLVDTTRRQIAVEPLPGAGAFNGVAGWMYALTHLSQLWRQPALADEALRALPQLRSALENDEALDLIGGSAGAMWCLLRMHRHHPHPLLLDV